MQLTGTSFARYTELYKSQWKDLMQSEHPDLLHDYANRGIWTTWTISYNSVRAKNKAAANLLLLWAHMDNKDFWYGLLAAAQQRDAKIGDLLSMWIHEVGSNELKFNDAMRLLRSYSMIEEMEDLTGYSAHPVVHEWARHIQDEEQQAELARLAVAVVGFAVPHAAEKEYWILQRRLRSHAQRCWQRILSDAVSIPGQGLAIQCERDTEREGVEVTLNAVVRLCLLFMDQDKLADPEQVFKLALNVCENALGTEHPFTLYTVNSLGLVYWYQGKLVEAEQMYIRALQGREKVLGTEHPSTFDTIDNLASLYQDQSKLVEAKQMYTQALQWREKALGTEHISTLVTVNNLGNFYRVQGELAEAEQMYLRALQGKEKVLGADHTITLNTVGSLGFLYRAQGKPTEAVNMYMRAIQGYEKALGPDHTFTLETALNLASVYLSQGKLTEAEALYTRALQGFEKVLGPEHPLTRKAAVDLGFTYYQCCDLWRSKRPTEAKEFGSKMLGLIHLCKRFGITSPMFCLLLGRLGRALIWEGQDNDAVIAFEQQISLDHDGIVCDGCQKRMDLTNKRFVCKVCLDVDLCNECHESYEREGVVAKNSGEKCQYHAFITVPRENWTKLDRGIISPDGMPLERWLENIESRYL